MFIKRSDFWNKEKIAEFTETNIESARVLVIGERRVFKVISVEEAGLYLEEVPDEVLIYFIRR